MPKIILVHLAIFAAFFGLVMPVLSHLVPGEVYFGGNLLDIAILTILSEVVVVASGVLGRLTGRVLGFNPLLQRKRSEALSAVLLVLVYGGFLYAIMAVAPYVISLYWPVAFILAAGVTVILFGVLYVKRAIIAGQKD
ncbi:MAG: hypothetical protein KC777_00430 [Cyanobacteria bacterium HKST-UBA02]|nr:hypothetical protein [Cyanobacteria bacterium HKST-UBA02]